MLNIWTTARRSAPLVLGLVLALGQVAPLHVQRVPASTESAPAKIEISDYELNHEIQARLFRVPEYKFLLAESQRMGMSVYLFGGTASAFAHYVRWDLMREQGDTRFQKDRFDYDFTNIYRSNQDLDIVVDGGASHIEALQQRLQSKFPYLQGNKKAWEVRSLRQAYKDKTALLNDADFLNQNTDSNSTGMILITDKPGLVVHDLRDWNNPESQFLNDVAEGKVHYYLSPLHQTTKRFKEGKNPPIFSAIRLLVKAVQFELEMRPEDTAIIKKIINDFDPASAAKNSYVSNWIEENGKKLVQNAVNIEYSLNLIDSLGLRSKLINVHNDAKRAGSLAWWLSKEPLRSNEVGKGKGRTARELGITVVAHETNSLTAHESITKAHTGDPNVLISRMNAVGEAAVYGDGFYTRIGRTGARDSGLTIRFNVDPEAREGKDFFVVPDSDYVVFNNKKALRVIQESLNVGLVEFFQLIRDQKIEKSDRAMLERLKRRLSNQASNISADDKIKLNNLVREEFGKMMHKKANETVILEWLSLPLSLQDPSLRGQALATLWKKDMPDDLLNMVARMQLDYTEVPQAPQIIADAILHQKDKGALHGQIVNSFIKEAISDILSRPGMVGSGPVLEALVREGYRGEAVNGFSHIQDIGKYPGAKRALMLFIADLGQRNFGREYIAALKTRVFDNPNFGVDEDIKRSLSKNGFDDVARTLQNVKAPIAPAQRSKPPGLFALLFGRGGNSCESFLDP